MESESKLIEDLQFQPRVGEESDPQKEKSEKGEEYDPAGEAGEVEDEDEDGDDEDDEEEFTFMFDGGNSSPITAEDAFVNGKIKPIFPLFGRYTLSGEDEVGLPVRPLVKNVFVEMDSGDGDSDEGCRVGSTVMLTSTSAEEEEGISGPYCEWSKGAAAPAPSVPAGCKKSNSTGFSKLWRFKDLLHRSNSDGRDAFVFLNSPPPSTSSSSSAAEAEKKKNGGEEVKATVNDRKGKGKKGGKTKTASLSPHEVYLRRKSEDDRRRSFRPEVFGFFTTVNGGMSRNVHPF